MSYKSEKNFQKVLFQPNKPLLEAELHEVQDIMNEARASLIRRFVPSGVLNISNIMTSVSGAYGYNSFIVYEFPAIVNGYEINHLFRNYDANEHYVTLKLPDPPTTGAREDFVFLEVWFSFVNSSDTINAYGNNLSGVPFPSDIIDPRVQTETTRRIQLKSRVRIVPNVDFQKYPNGFNDVLSVIAQGDNTAPQIAYPFKYAVEAEFENKVFFHDVGLHVAGNGSEAAKQALRSEDGFVYAIPLFKVKRRNSSGYSSDNPNGALLYGPGNTMSDRIDGLFANIIVNDDIVDMRHLIDVSGFNLQNLLEGSYHSLITGGLNGGKYSQLKKIYFGRQEFVDDDKTNLLCHFNNVTGAGNRENGVSNTSPIAGTVTVGYTPKFKSGINGEGIYLKGYDIQYPVLFSTSETTIELFTKPDWHGYETTTKTLITGYDTGAQVMFDVKKVNSKLRLNFPHNSISYDIDISDINAGTWFYVKLSWSQGSDTLEFTINCNESKTIRARSPVWSGSSVPATIKLSEQGASSWDSIIDEFRISNIVRTTSVSTVPTDIRAGYAILAEGFNGQRSSFSDLLQSNWVVETILTALDATDIVIKGKTEDALIDNDPTATPIVYQLTASTAIVVPGTWAGLGTKTATFTPDTSGDPNIIKNKQITVQYKAKFTESNGQKISVDCYYPNIHDQNGKSIYLGALDDSDKEIGNTTYKSVSPLGYIEHTLVNGTNTYTIPPYNGYPIVGIVGTLTGSGLANFACSDIIKNVDGSLTLNFAGNLANDVKIGYMPANLGINLVGSNRGISKNRNDITFSKTTTVESPITGNNSVKDFYFVFPEPVKYSLFMQTGANNGFGFKNNTYYAWVNGKLKEIVGTPTGFGTTVIKITLAVAPGFNEKVELTGLCYHTPAKNDMYEVFLKEKLYPGSDGSADGSIVELIYVPDFVTLNTVGSSSLDFSTSKFKYMHRYLPTRIEDYEYTGQILSHSTIPMDKTFSLRYPRNGNVDDSKTDSDMFRTGLRVLISKHPELSTTRGYNHLHNVSIIETYAPLSTSVRHQVILPMLAMITQKHKDFYIGEIVLMIFSTTNDDSAIALKNTLVDLTSVDIYKIPGRPILPQLDRML